MAKKRTLLKSAALLFCFVFLAGIFLGGANEPKINAEGEVFTQIEPIQSEGASNVEVNVEFEKDVAFVGDQVEVTLTITNNGPNEIYNVSINEEWESAATFTHSSFDEVEIPSIAAGETLEQNVTVNVLETGGTLPLDFGITIDASGSMGSSITSVKNKLVDLLDILRSRSSLQTGISVFGWGQPADSNSENPYLAPQSVTVPLTDNASEVI